VHLFDVPANPHLKDKDGDSALALAASGGHTDAVVELVKAGAKLDLHNNFGDSALMTAAKNGHTDAVVELVKAGAKLDIQNKVCSYI
jgi:ankyrin repeat protein